MYAGGVSDKPSYEEIVAKNDILHGENDVLHGEIDVLHGEIDVLHGEIDVLRIEVSRLTGLTETQNRKIAELERKIGRNSSNSSLPPSSDLFARPAKPESPNRKARRAMGRLPGKQPGDTGHHLAQVKNPDEVIVHRPEACDSCGAALDGAEVIGEEVRQVFDIPEPKMVVSEHRVVKLRCSCGKCCELPFPPVARSSTCYGPRIRANALYLLARQHISSNDALRQ